MVLTIWISKRCYFFFFFHLSLILPTAPPSCQNGKVWFEFNTGCADSCRVATSECETDFGVEGCFYADFLFHKSTILYFLSQLPHPARMARCGSSSTRAVPTLAEWLLPNAKPTSASKDASVPMTTDGTANIVCPPGSVLATRRPSRIPWDRLWDRIAPYSEF